MRSIPFDRTDEGLPAGCSPRQPLDEGQRELRNRALELRVLQCKQILEIKTRRARPARSQRVRTANIRVAVAFRELAVTASRLRLSPAPEDGLPRRNVRAATPEEGSEKAGSK